MYLFSRILKGPGFRGGSDEKIRRMSFGLEIDVVGLPPLMGGGEEWRIFQILKEFRMLQIQNYKPHQLSKIYIYIV